MKRTIYIGADSAGFELKGEVIAHLRELGYTVFDLGTNSSESCHYPVFAKKVCEAVQAAADNAFGILICGTGIGMSMCANKHRGIRAALCSDTYSARMTRAHNDANLLCMGARVIGSCLALDIVDAFLSAEFEGGRHALRVEMMMDIEKN
ncbi:MAG: ribose 5-phosphate isomerase B [Clostridia bacterium]|nr:ribose 5-phosphate isomerase B [Clostridia bacterium]